MMSPAAGTRATGDRRYAWLVVAMLWCICFFNYADRQAVFSVFPLLQKEMNLSLVEMGALGSAFAWLYGLGAPIAGSVVDRIRRKSGIMGGLYVWSTICMATATARTFPQLLFFRAAEGCGETIYYPATVSLISDYHGRETRSRALGFLQTSVYVGTIGGGFFAGLIGQNYGWRWSFIVFGGLGILLGLFLQRYLKEPVRGAAEAPVANPIPKETLTPLQTIASILRTPAALLLMATFVCANFVAVVLLSWMPTFLHDRFHMSLAMAGLSATLFAQLAGMAGAATGGWLADAAVKRTPRGRLFVQAAGVFAGAPFVVLCGMTQSVTWLIVALTGWGFFKGLYDANIFASPFDVIPPEARGTMAGLMNCVGWLGGGGSAPIIVALIAQRTSLGFAIAATSVVYCVAGLLLVTCALFFTDRAGKTARLA
ncbi:MAG TPA: MFS transporter [Bryobacteraceae bacterium]|jgi:MFS family permease